VLKLSEEVVLFIGIFLGPAVWLLLGNCCVTHLYRNSLLSMETTVQVCDASTAKLLMGCRANKFCIFCFLEYMLLVYK
jgi:hypothetical protein